VFRVLFSVIMPTSGAVNPYYRGTAREVTWYGGGLQLFRIVLLLALLHLLLLVVELDERSSRSALRLVLDER
jgi:hypothetical protein